MTLTLQPTKQNDMIGNNSYKESENKHTTDKDKNKQVHSKIKIHFKNITKIEKDKKLNMTEHKVDINITKYNKLNMTEHKTTMNITEKLSSTFMKEH